MRFSDWSSYVGSSDRVGRIVVGDLDQFRIGHEQRLLFLVFAGDVDDDGPLQHADLGRGQADAGGVVHGLQHVVHQPPDAVVAGLDGSANLLQARVGGGDGRSRGPGPVEVWSVRLW